ncbi:MAG: TldD/PmbA family protein [Proteobacteria bacterium]|nr:TldD/PmbA family protein [Pseudomonadota bacterium]
MTIREQAEQAEKVLDRVQAAGATGDLIVDEGQSLSLKARDGELEEYKVSSSRVFGLRIIKDGKVGTAYSEASDAEALVSMVDQALTNASFAAVEVHEKILPNAGDLRTDDALLHPEDGTGIDRKIQMALTLERDLAAREKVKNVPYNGVQDNSNQRHIFTTSGLSAYSRSRVCAAYAYALVEEGDKNAMEGTGQASRLFSEIDAARIADKVYANCIGILDGKPVPSKHYDVIFDEECQTALFNVFALMVSGKSAKDGVNPMRDKVGQAIADSRLTVVDNPLLVDGFGYALFDAEGTPTEKTPLLVDGRLETLLHNSATASHFGLKTTGHAKRSPKSTLDVGLHQMEIVAGNDDTASLQAGDYLELTDLTGLHSGANAISGDFSFGASGYLCRDGERTRPVRSITVAGNFYEMLRKISRIGDKQHWNWEKSSLMPSIRFADVAISG